VSERDDPEVTVRVTDKRVKDQSPAPPEAGPEAPAPEEAGIEPADELAQARAEAQSHLDDLRRLKAEFENYRKRMTKEQTQMIERASAALIERMLPILDDFELALMAADRTKDYESMVRGVEMVYGKLVDELHKDGLRRIDALGKAFDPELHEAVMRVEGEGDDVVVLDEMRPGYLFHGRVLRPTMVKVGHRRS
jgi:molecular chaperone GrpE